MQMVECAVHGKVESWVQRSKLGHCAFDGRVQNCGCQGNRVRSNRGQFIQHRFDALGDGGCIFWGVRDLAGGAMHQFALKFFTVGGLT